MPRISYVEGRKDYFWQKPISEMEVIFSSIVLVIFSAFLVTLLAHYPYYPCCFHQLSSAIRRWDFSALPPSQPKEFWGFSYLSALVATITRLPDIWAIVLVSSTSFVIANFLCCRLWGAAVAAWFMVINYWWIDGATEGLTEPLFMAVLLGSFMAFRSQRWVIAAILASAATIIRPAGIFALIAIGIVLLARRDWRRLVITTAIGLATGFLYVIPMLSIFGDPLANVKGYHRSDWSSVLPLTFPLLPIIKGAAMQPARAWRHQILTSVWLLFIIAGAARMFIRKHFWDYARIYPMEAIFSIAYILLLFSYNVPYWNWLHFPRFAIPLLPFILTFSFDRLPRDRRILWDVALLNVIIATWPKVTGSYL